MPAASTPGEIKKSIFTILNYTLPLKGVLSMHCSANVGKDGDSALFFGLSGTGKTTLSSDPQRGLIGDDEHGWSDRGIFNFEGGCYAKVIKLSKEAEPQIWEASRRFGTILENVVLDPDTREMDLDDMTYTENTRSSYPLSFIDNAIPSGQAGHPKNVVMLTADAYGAMPPIARLTPEGAMYHFLSGLHRARRRHRARRHGAEGDLQHLFRRAVPPAQSERLREDARRADREAQGARVAGEHRLDRRAVRRRLANEDRATRAP